MEQTAYILPIHEYIHINRLHSRIEASVKIYFLLINILICKDSSWSQVSPQKRPKGLVPEFYTIETYSTTKESNELISKNVTKRSQGPKVDRFSKTFPMGTNL